MFNLSLWQLILLTVILTHITTIAITLYLHRSATHRALVLHPALSRFFRFWLWFTTGIKTKEWVAVHRLHHSSVDLPGDPHSPKNEGIFAVLFGGYFLYKRAIKDSEMINRYGKDCPDDWIEKNLYHKWSSLGLFILLAINFILFGWPGIIVWLFQILWTPFAAGGVVNGLGHFIGYRNYKTDDFSRNILPFDFLLGGEMLHNNHHFKQWSAKLSHKWWEVDFGWLYIKLFIGLRLAELKNE